MHTLQHHMSALQVWSHCNRPTRRTGEVDDVGYAAVADHIVVAQQVAAKGVDVARAVGLVRQLAAAWGQAGWRGGGEGA